jgi:hypothetical protein
MSKAIILPPQKTGSERVHVRTDTSRRANTVNTSQTSVSTTAIKITTPSDAKNFLFKHEDPNVTIWIGTDSTVTAGGTSAWPVNHGDILVLDQFQLDDDNSIYAIADSGTVTVYCIGKYLES